MTTRRAAPDGDLGTPPVAELLDVIDAPGNGHQPPCVGAVSGPRILSGAGAAPAPSRSSDAARRRGAPYAVPDAPDDSNARPDARAVTSFARRTSTAPVASWTTMRRPVASSNAAGAVTIASMVTSRSVMPRAVATEPVWTGLRAGRRPRVVRRWASDSGWPPAMAMPTRWRGHELHVGRVAQPHAVPVEGALARGALAGDAGQPIGRALRQATWR